MGLSVRFPRQRAWEILPGARSFLNCWRGGGVVSLNGVADAEREGAAYLWGDVEGAVGDVEIPYHEDEECHVG